MQRALAIADRTASIAIRLMALANLLLFASFLAIALLAAGRAHAEPPCTGCAAQAIR